MAAVPSLGRASLVEAPARASHAAATEGLYERHAAKILGYCLHQLGSREEAEDAVQTTFMNAFRALGRGVVPESESAWLFKIAENVCLSRRRSSWRRGRIESPSDFEVIEEIVPGPSRQRDELIGIEDALASMPEQQRRAILLREWQGLSYREIAEELEVSQSAVETLIFRARRSLAHGLEQPEAKQKPKRKRLRRALHVIDFGTVVAAAKTLLAGSAAVKATAAAVAVTAAAGTAASVKNEGHSPQPAEATPAAVAKAPQVPRPVPAPLEAAATVAPIATHDSLVPRARPAVPMQVRKSLRERRAAAQAGPKQSASVAPARVAPVPAPQASAPVPAAVLPQPAPAPAEPAEAAPPPPVAEPQPAPAGEAPKASRAEERKAQREERRAEREQQRAERRDRGRRASAEPVPQAQPAAVVAPAPAPDETAAPAEPQEDRGERRRGRRAQRELATLAIVEPAAAVEEATAEPAPAPAVEDPAAAPEAEQDEAHDRQPGERRRGRRR